MKNKLLLKAMAVILSTVCLAGCSQTPATENTSSGTETEVETTTTTTEASVEETESSTTESEEVVADIDITKTAVAYGMTAADEFKAAVDMRNAGTPYYYAAKDAEEANFLAKTYIMHIAAYTEFDLDGFVMCGDNYPVENTEEPTPIDTPNAFTFAYQMDAKSSESAKEMYGYGVEWLNHLADYGEVKSGDNYTIIYTELYVGDIQVVEMYGIYVIGDTVIWIESWTNTVNNDACIDFFCNDLGLESPTSLRK